MSIFRVGQRCRIVSARIAELIGKECTIVGLSVCWPGAWSILVDGDPKSYAADSENLEPLTPPHIPAEADFQQAFDSQFLPVKVTL